MRDTDEDLNELDDVRDDDAISNMLSAIRLSRPRAPRERTEMKFTAIQSDVFGRVVSYLSPLDMASLLGTSRGDDLWTQAIVDTLIARAKNVNRLQWLYDHRGRPQHRGRGGLHGMELGAKFTRKVWARVRPCGLDRRVSA